MSNQARTKQTARLGTGSVSARQSQQWRNLTIQASSYDPPIIQTRHSDRVEVLLAQFADDDLTRDATYRYEDLVERTLTGIISRKRRDDCIAACKAQILAERAQAADAAAALLTLAPEAVAEFEDEPETEAAEAEAEPEAEAAATEPPVPITGNKRNRAPLKTKGSITYNKARGEHAPEYWTVTYRRCRNTFYSKATAEAVLANYKTNNVCPGCKRARELECEQCGHTHGDPIQPAQAPAPVPADPTPVADPIPMQIRCRTTAVGTLTVTVNGVTFTVHGDFVYP